MSEQEVQSPIKFNPDGSLDIDLGGDTGWVHIPRPTVRRWKEVGVVKDMADEWLKQRDREIRERTGFTEDIQKEMLSALNSKEGDGQILEVSSKLIEYNLETSKLLYAEDNPYPKVLAEITGRPVDELPSWATNSMVYDAIISHWVNVPLNPSNPARS